MSRYCTPSESAALARLRPAIVARPEAIVPRPNPWDQIEAITDFETLRNFLIAHSGVFEAPPPHRRKDPA